jgi:peptidoglycan/xylan/chitin deacetylase (PgdA/CDA1 family)
MANLFGANTPENLWRCLVNVTEEQWQAAIHAATPALPMPCRHRSVEALLEAVLGEGQFGDRHWTLGPVKRLYYMLKPFLPHSLRCRLRRFYGIPTQAGFPLGWPIEDRYVRFQWDVMRHLASATGRSDLPCLHFWPQDHRFAFVLTHDVETAAGQAHVRRVADLETSLGFRSSFNFVPERYPLDRELLQELRARGFEIGIHGLKHDGKLFSSYGEFARRARRINGYLKEFGAVGFRAPLTHRQPEWMQALEIEYDLSFFDTDPFEPMPGGTMSVWPFEMGRFVELPYTLVQDYTLTTILGEQSPRIWLEKVDFVERYYGMALVNTHPDYLADAMTWTVYAEFLQAMRSREGYWHVLPRDVARWWRARSRNLTDASLPGAVRGRVQVGAQGVAVSGTAWTPKWGPHCLQ